MAIVSLTELEEETADLGYFTMVGIDDQFAYYETPDGREFELPAAESQMHRRILPGITPMHLLAPGNGIALFVKLRGGQWVQPDRDDLPGAGEGYGW